jgi:hypothetical protein
MVCCCVHASEMSEFVMEETKDSLLNEYLLDSEEIFRSLELVA